MKRTLNLGCGIKDWGTDRVDMMVTPTTTLTMDIDGNRLPYENNTFDEIRCHRVLEHIKDIGLLISECYRILKVGGKLDLQTDFAGYIIYHVKTEHNSMLDRTKKANGDHHYHLFVKSHLKYLLGEFRYREFSYPKHPQKKWWKRFILYYLLPFRMGYEEIRVVATK